MRLVVLLMLLAQVGEAEPCDAASCTWSLGMRLFRQGDYDEAIEWFKKGWAFTSQPKFLFELAESHRLMGRCAEAVRLYSEFLEVAPNTANRLETEDHLLDCAETVARDKRHALDHAWKKRNHGQLLLGLGSASLIAGVALSVSALFVRSDYQISLILAGTAGFGGSSLFLISFGAMRYQEGRAAIAAIE